MSVCGKQTAIFLCENFSVRVQLGRCCCCPIWDSINITIDFNSFLSNTYTLHALKIYTMHRHTHTGTQTLLHACKLCIAWNCFAIYGNPDQKTDCTRHIKNDNERERETKRTQNPLDALKRIKCIYILLD